MVGHVVLRILGRTIGLWVGIDAEHRVVARLTRPHPVVGLTTKLTHRFGDGEYQTYILEIAIGGHIVFVTFVEGLDFNTQCGILLTYVLLPYVLDGIDEFFHILEFQLVHAQTVQFVRHVLLLNHKTDEEVFVWQFFGIALGIKAIQHIVVLNGRVLADGIEAAVVVGEYKSIGRYHDT